MRTRVAIALLMACAMASGEEHGGGPWGIFRTEVPSHPFSLILGRPTRQSVTISVLASANMEGLIRFGKDDGPCTNVTTTVRFKAGEPTDVPIGSLNDNSPYRYQFCYCSGMSGVFTSSAQYAFHTQRPPGSPFTFTVTADSHLDENTDPAIYAQTLANALADHPDFHIDLGDTFMAGKRRDRPGDALPQYLAQRYYFGQLCHSAPLFLVLGNHDGEFGGQVDEATRMRTAYFPNPFPDGFYTGSTSENYYAWHWGDALFVVLDPFRYSERPRRGQEGDNWSFTLGRPQYDWLRKTLEASSARAKFVFIHHLVGGGDRQGRGGAEAVPFFEWGGRDPDGRDAFAEKRPGWPLPIHALLVKHGVSAVFHGHDHFFAKQEVDGIVYQLVPQPGHPGDGSLSQAADYGYLNGDTRPGSGYLRVTVTTAKVTVDYVRTQPSVDRNTGQAGSVVYSYAITSIAARVHVPLGMETTDGANDVKSERQDRQEVGCRDEGRQEMTPPSTTSP